MALADSINLTPLFAAAKRAHESYKSSAGAVRQLLGLLQLQRKLKTTTNDDLLAILVADRPVTPDAREALLTMIAAERQAQVPRMGELPTLIATSTQILRERARLLTRERNDPMLHLHKLADNSALITELEGRPDNAIRMSNVTVLPLVLGNGDHALRVTGNIYRHVTNGDTQWPNVYDTRTGALVTGDLKLNLRPNAATLNVTRRTVRVDGLWRRQELLTERMVSAAASKHTNLGFRILSTLNTIVRSSQYQQPGAILPAGISHVPIDTQNFTLDIPEELIEVYGSRTVNVTLVTTYDYDDTGTIAWNPERLHLFPRTMNIAPEHMEQIRRAVPEDRHLAPWIAKATVVPKYDVQSRFSTRSVNHL